MLPLIPIFALIGILSGAVTLVWYDQLPAEQKEKADRIAADYAKLLFNKGLAELTTHEAKRVAKLTQEHFSK